MRILFIPSQSNNALAISERFQMKALSSDQFFQIEQAIAKEVGCNLAHVKISKSSHCYFVWFPCFGINQCAIIWPDGEYWGFRESIRKSFEEAKSLAA